MLRRIGLENFKSWKQLDIEFAPITLLFGRIARERLRY